MSKENQPATRAEKRARFAAQAQKRNRRIPPVALVLGAVAIIAAVIGIVVAVTRPAGNVAAAPAGSSAAVPASNASAAAAPKAATLGHAPFPLVQAENGSIRLPLATFDDSQAHFYTFMNDGRPIEFFVLKSKDGTVRAALNACEVCFPAKKGYHQEGDEMVCNNCGRRFPSDQIGVVRGGCNPVPLKPAVEGDTLVIQVPELVAGQTFF